MHHSWLTHDSLMTRHSMQLRSILLSVACKPIANKIRAALRKLKARKAHRYTDTHWDTTTHTHTSEPKSYLRVLISIYERAYMHICICITLSKHYTHPTHHTPIKAKAKARARAKAKPKTQQIIYTQYIYIYIYTQYIFKAKQEEMSINVFMYLYTSKHNPKEEENSFPAVIIMQRKRISVSVT